MNRMNMKDVFAALVASFALETAGELTGDFQTVINRSSIVYFQHYKFA